MTAYEAPPAPAPAPFGPRLRHHTVDLMRLAWPVMLSRAGILVMAFTDIAMLGRYAAGAAGEANLGLSIFVPVLVSVIGFSSGIAPVAARAFGSGEWEECGRVWRRAMVWGTVVSLLGAWVVWHGETILGLLGQPPDIAEKGGAVARALAPGIVGQTLFAVSAFYLEATRRPMTGLVVMIFANIINFGLNWLLIYGTGGFPEMGPVGAAIATTLARFFAAGAIIAVILAQADPRGAGVTGPWETFWGPGGWRAGFMMRKLGLSAGFANGSETVGFAAMNLFAAGLGPIALDAYTISNNMVSTLFMVALGLAIATGVRVGNEMGRGRPEEAAFAGWTGLGVAVVVMALIGVAVFVWRPELGALYSDDPEVLARTTLLLAVTAFVFIPDSMQVVLGQAVRALGDAYFAIGAYALCFIVLMIPLGWWMIGPAGFDERGLVVAIIIACVVVTAMLAIRFRVVTVRAMRS